MADIPRYTIINHVARLKLGLTNDEYCIADIIYHLQNNPRNKSRWAYVSSTWLGEILGISQPSAYRAIKLLEKRHLLNREPASFNRARSYRMQVSLDWYDKVIIKKSIQNEYTSGRVYSKSRGSIQNDNTRNRGGSIQNEYNKDNKDINKETSFNKNSKAYKDFLKKKDQLKRKHSL